MDKDIENYLKDKNILNIMNKVSFPYKNNIDHDEILQGVLSSHPIYISSFLLLLGARLRKRKKNMLVNLSEIAPLA
jgi:hypothetical protein